MRLLRIGCGAALTLALVGPALAGLSAPAPARLAFGEGDVLVLTDGAAGWVGATANLPLGPGDWIWVPGPGWAELQLASGHAVRLGGATRLGIRALPAAPDGGVAELVLDRGMAWIAGERASAGATVRIALTPGVVTLAAAARVRLAVADDGTVEVAVVGGEAWIETPAERLPVVAGQTLRLRPGQLASLPAVRATDEVDRWSQRSDPAIDRDPSRPYLPPALAPYAAEFSAYGRWFSVPDQGYAWAPTVELGWTPFREGQWRWWHGASVWIPDEPWGWVTAHYGRWLFVSGVGWVWLPPAERIGEQILAWHPGAVAWIGGPDFVAWVPLGPGEPDELDQPEAAASASVTNVFVTEINVTNVFVNARAPHGVVVSPRDSFVAGRRPLGSFSPSRNVFAGGGRRMARLPVSLRPPSLAVDARPGGTLTGSRGAPTWGAPAGGLGGRPPGPMPPPAGSGPPRGVPSLTVIAPAAPGASRPGAAGFRTTGPAGAGGAGTPAPPGSLGARGSGPLLGGRGVTP